MKIGRISEEKGKRRKSLKNVRWVSHYLGVSRNTVHQWVLEGHIPYINLGVKGGRRIIRFDQEKIEAWLLERSHTPEPKKQAEEISEETDRDNNEIE